MTYRKKWPRTCAALVALLLGRGAGIRADFQITTDPGDGGTVDYGYVVVGTTSSRSITAQNTGDAPGYGFFASPVGQTPAVFAPGSNSVFWLGFDSDSNTGDLVHRDYSFTPGARGVNGTQVQVSYGTPDNPGPVAATITLTGQGVAAVSAPIDQQANNAGYVLVGKKGEVSVTVKNIGDGMLSGQEEGHLLGLMSSGAGRFSLNGNADIRLGDNTSKAYTYTFSPDQRGASVKPLQANFLNGSPDGTNQGHIREFEVKGTGVAPVSTRFNQSANNAGYTLVGTSKTASVSVTNVGDGNLSGLGAVSNLNGTIAAGTGAFALKGSTDISLKDGATGTYNYAFKPSQRGAVVEKLTAQFENGSVDGTNSAHVRHFSVQGTGVAPVSTAVNVSHANAGYTLVGMSKTASVGITNVGDGNLSGLGPVSNLNGTITAGAGAFSLKGSNDISLKDGATGTYNYAFNPSQRGTYSNILWANFTNGSADGMNNAHSRSFEVSGTGVAPVNAVGKTDAGLTRIGTSSMASVQIMNIGDGNLSGLGAVSNLRGSVSGVSSATFNGTGGVVSLMDKTSATYNYRYTPADHAANSAVVALNFSNGSTDGHNQAQAGSVTLSGQGVGPIFHSSRAPGSTLDFGKVEIGDNGRMSLDIHNVSRDPNGGISTLTDLTLLHAIIDGPDAGLFTLAGFHDGSVLHNMDVEALNLWVHFNPDGDTTLGEKHATLTFVTDQGAAFGHAGDIFTFALQGQAVPEPGSIFLACIAVVCLAGFGWRRAKRVA
jgi:hypothetical protein